MILTIVEAAAVLGYDSTSDMPTNVTLIILPAIDDYIKNATGFSFGDITTTYAAINPTAKLTASMLLANWFDNPSMVGSDKEMPFGVTNLLTQLHAVALELKE